MFKIDENGNYQAGFREVRLSEIKLHLVDAYPTSVTRARNFASLVRIVNHSFISDYGDLVKSLWVDGSFCSRKENPNDIDGVILFSVNNEQDLERLFEFIENWNEQRDMLKSNYTDLYYALDLECCEMLLEIGTAQGNSVIMNIGKQFKDNYLYWMEWFTTDRSGKKKAMYSIDFRREFLENDA